MWRGVWCGVGVLRFGVGLVWVYGLSHTCILLQSPALSYFSDQSYSLSIYILLQSPALSYFSHQSHSRPPTYLTSVTNRITCPTYLTSVTNRITCPTLSYFSHQSYSHVPHISYFSHQHYLTSVTSRAGRPTHILLQSPIV